VIDGLSTPSPPRRASERRDHRASLRGRFVPAVSESELPASVLSRVLATEEEPAVVVLLRLLGPVTTRPGLEASAL
jgi:hypothetical protein